MQSKNFIICIIVPTTHYETNLYSTNITYYLDITSGTYEYYSICKFYVCTYTILLFNDTFFFYFTYILFV